MTQSEQPKRRFAPVPIETTFQSVRKSDNRQLGPNPELTPEQSPRSASPPPREQIQKRKFAPQLIETSRRSRRVGDAGPATRPTDKTDITPYTRNIYTAKHVSRREWEDSFDEELERPMPPTRRETEDEGVKEYLLDLAAKAAERQLHEEALAAFPNSHAREGGVAHFYFQESSDSDELTEDVSGHDLQQRGRRKSSNLGINWWHKHMQEHVQQTQETEDVMNVDKEPTDAELDKMDIEAPPDPLWTTTKRAEDEEEREPTAKTQGDTQGPIKTDFATSSATQKPAGSPFGTPFGAFLPKADPKEKKKKGVSPPMLGDDLVFRTCPSPKHTKLETDHPFIEKDRPDKHRDLEGGGGLWRGYCYRSESDETYLVPAQLKPAPMISTPYPAAQTPGGPMATDYFSQEPISPGKPGLHSLQGLDERLRRAQARAEKNEKIAAEFGDDFVTQVYNYLSLGYPSMARGFDDELSRISRIDIEDLRSEDNKPLAKGYMLELKLQDSRAGERCPRWRALRVYITEWAKQHPDVDNLDPMAWGVRERRGSWGI